MPLWNGVPLLNLFYPVGSIYWSSNNTNPGTLFGGTWTQIKDKFILAAGDSYSNGATGGAATVTLTVSNMPSHSHSFTPSGTVGSHTHTGPSHTHSFTPSGTVASHTHSFTPSGTVSSSFSGTAGTTGNQSANPTFSGSHKHSHTCISGSSYLTYYQDKQNGVAGNNNNQTNGQTNDTGYVTTDEKTVTISGTTSGNHTHSFTPSGTVSSSFSGTAGTTAETAPSFSGTAGYTGAAGTGNTGATAPSFTGTAGTTGANGSGSSFSILPPYIVKYCWERTA